MKEIFQWGVNWKDGMKINADHFKKEREHLISLLNVYASINIDNSNFGLIGDNISLDLRYSISNNEFVIEQIFAISRKGTLAFVNEENVSTVGKIKLKDIIQDYDDGQVAQIYIKVDNSKVYEFGSIDDEEFPIRYPHISPVITLEHMKLDYALYIDSLDSHIPIAQLINVNGKMIVDEAYIPPVRTCMSNKKLRDKHQELSNLNFQLAGMNSEIAQKISGKSHSSYLKSNILILSTQMAFFLANYMDEFNDEYILQSPKMMVTFYKKMSRIINACLISMQKKEKIIQYMADWTGLTPQEFIDHLDAMNEFYYNHLNIKESIANINNFTDIISKLFERLKDLNYKEFDEEVV